MSEDILATYDYGDVYMIVDKFGQKVNRETLLNQLYVGIKNKEIELYRSMNRGKIFEIL